MAIRTHVAYTQPMKINKLGAVVDQTTSTIAQNLQTRTELRIIADASNSNTADNPTIQNYIAAEAADDYVVGHLSNTMIITYHAGDLNAAT